MSFGPGNPARPWVHVDAAHAGGIFRRYDGAKVYKDYRKMLEEQKDIDAVVIATPDHQHAIIAMAAMRLVVVRPYPSLVITRTVASRMISTVSCARSCWGLWRGAVGDRRGIGWLAMLVRRRGAGKLQPTQSMRITASRKPKTE